MNSKQAKKFLKSVKNYAKDLSLSATAKRMKTSIPTFHARLIKATSLLQEAPPTFAVAREKASSKNEEFAKIQASGRGGRAKKIVIPQRFFEELGWGVKQNVKIRLYGKKKLIIEKEK